jgi:hypothetical protein
MKTTIQISDELRLRIKLLAMCKNTTYESALKEIVEDELSRMNVAKAARAIENNRNKIKKRKKG